MTEKIFEAYEDETYYNVVKNNKTGEILNDAGEIADLLNTFHEALKKELMAMSGVLCDACKHCRSYLVNTPYAYEYDMECKKKHEVLTDDAEQECEDFELMIGDRDD